MFSCAMLVASALVLWQACLVAGHGGVLHPWVLGQPGYQYLRYPLARCPASNFKVFSTAGGGETSSIPGPVPLFNKQPNATLTLGGFIDAWVYLPQNCSNQVTSALWTDLNVTYTATGEPYANSTMYTYGVNAPCSRGSTMDLYRSNASLGDNRFNLMWVNAGVSNGLGRFLGSAVNAFRARGPQEPRGRPNALYSLIFLPDPSVGPAMCCDLEWNVAPPTRFFNQGHPCASSEDRR